MRVEIRFPGSESSEALREYAEHRIDFHLSMFRDELRSVVVRFSGVLDSRRSVDARCHVTLRGQSFGPLVLAELSADAYAAVDLAIERAAREVVQQMQRERSSLRVEGPPDGVYH